MIPIHSLDNVVPPVLHITLGIVLRLFNLLVDECRKLDNVDNSKNSTLKSNEKLWKSKCERVEKK